VCLSLDEIRVLPDAPLLRLSPFSHSSDGVSIRSSRLRFEWDYSSTRSRRLTRAISSPHAAHHIPLPFGAMPLQGQPGALSPNHPGATAPVSVGRMNEVYLNNRDPRDTRLEVDARGYEGVFSQ
jgi:hypothetical protein